MIFDDNTILVHPDDYRKLETATDKELKHIMNGRFERTRYDILYCGAVVKPSILVEPFLSNVTTKFLKRKLLR